MSIDVESFLYRLRNRFRNQYAHTRKNKTGSFKKLVTSHSQRTNLFEILQVDKLNNAGCFTPTSKTYITYGIKGRCFIETGAGKPHSQLSHRWGEYKPAIYLEHVLFKALAFQPHWKQQLEQKLQNSSNCAQLKWIHSVPIKVRMHEAPVVECLLTFILLLHDRKIEDEKTNI